MEMTAKELKQLLLPIHLYYDLGSASLRARAVGEIITKVLYMAKENSLELEEIAEQVAQLVGIKKVPEEDILDGLEFLLDKGTVIHLNPTDPWVLTEEAVEQIENNIKSSQFRNRKILENHFNRKIDLEQLIKWFRVANADFFGAYGEIWVKTIYGNKSTELPAKSFLRKILSPSIKKCGLGLYFEDLIEGYRKFLLNVGEQINTAQIWSFAQAMLSAKLIMVGVGPDPITIREFRGAKIFLDTNILIDIALKRNDQSEAFLRLAESLEDIGTTLYVTERTKEEYRNLVSREREKIIKLVKTLPRSVLRNLLIDSKDQFALAAIARDCDNLRSYERFFSEIKNPPTGIGNMKIKLEDSVEINEIAKESEGYVKRQNEVAAEWLRYYSWPKPKHSVEHDVTLDAIVDCLRKDKSKIWILTADRSMQSLSQRWAINVMPAWVSLDTVIHLLAVYGAGPKHDPNNFAPLLSRLIKAEIQLTEDLYNLEDIVELVDIEERSKELSKEEIETLANKIAKARVAGRSRYDRELSLEINRVLQRKKITENVQVQQIKQRATNLEEELTREQIRKNAIFMALVKKLAEKKKQQERIKYIGIFILSLTTGALILFFGIYLLEKGDTGLAVMCIGLGLTELILPVFKWIFPEYKKAMGKAEQWANSQASHLADLEEKTKK